MYVFMYMYVCMHTHTHTYAHVHMSFIVSTSMFFPLIKMYRYAIYHFSPYKILSKFSSNFWLKLFGDLGVLHLIDSISYRRRYGLTFP